MDVLIKCARCSHNITTVALDFRNNLTIAETYSCIVWWSPACLDCQITIRRLLGQYCEVRPMPKEPA